MTSNAKLVKLRRLLIVFGFFVAVFVFAMLYYLKFLPANREELSQRGNRVLTQLMANFANKDRDIRNIVTGSGKNYKRLLEKTTPYNQLNASLPYDTVSPADLRRKVVYPDTSQLPLIKKENGQWRILFKGDSTGDTTYMSFRVKDFAEQILSARDDIFEDYLVFLDTGVPPASGGSPQLYLKVICRKNGYGPAGINADTLLVLNKNSDGSGTFNISLAGEKYVLFYQPFEFHGRRIALGGLLSNEAYNRKLIATPPFFFPIGLIVVCLVIISLPFLKVYLLSPRESICSRDVLSTAASIFIGSAVLSIIVFYSFFSLATTSSLRYRLRHFSSLIRSDLEEEIRQADEQLLRYDSAIGGLPLMDPTKVSICNRNAADHGYQVYRTDLSCKPAVTGDIVQRLMWLDTMGNTIAKWSPFAYPTPFTNLGRYEFFNILATKPAYYDGIPGLDVPVVYTGKSNLTDEFQTVVARYSDKTFPHWEPPVSGQPAGEQRIDTASFVAIAIQLHCTIQPVMPNGFGFSLIDRSGKVLIDGESRNSLGENLFDESGNNAVLLQAVANQRSDISFAMELYGNPYMANIFRISNQPFYLVTYFDQKAALPNILRFLHFSYQTLILLWLVILGCLGLSRYKTWKPDILSFNLQRQDWIQPSDDSDEANSGRERLFIWFCILAAATLLSILSELFFEDNLDGLFFISLLLPFYVLLGARYVAAGKSVVKYAVFVIGVINVFMILLVIGRWGFMDSVLMPFLFQAVMMAAVRIPKYQGKIIGKSYSGYYYPNLCLAIVLISIIPTIGILTHAFFAEKFQYKKQKMAGIANAFYKRSNYLVEGLFLSFKTDVAPETIMRNRLLFRNSIYLTDHDSLVQESDYNGNAVAAAAVSPDALYRQILEQLYHVPAIWGDPITISDRAGDSSWHYQYIPTSEIVYMSGRPVDHPSSYLKILSNLQRPQSDLAGLGRTVSLFSIVVMLALLYSGWRLLAGTIERLFLLQFIKKGKIVEDDTWLSGRFTESAMKGRGVYLQALAVNEAYDDRLLDLELAAGGGPAPIYTQAEYILAMKDYYTPFYQRVWDKMDDNEKYIIYDFCRDSYTNYKNSTSIYKLMSKRILKAKEGRLYTFSLSFRQFVLSLAEDGDLIDKLNQQYRAPGLWASIRLPVFLVLAVISVFLYLTAPAFGTLLITVGTLAGTATTLITFWKNNVPAAKTDT